MNIITVTSQANHIPCEIQLVVITTSFTARAMMDVAVVISVVVIVVAVVMISVVLVAVTIVMWWKCYCP